MPPPSSRFRRTCRRVWRACRLTGWLLILALFGALIYLNRSGLPDFVKRPVLDNLRARGLDLDVARLRLHFYRGLVARDVKFRHAESAESPRFAARNLEVKLDYSALVRGRLRVTGVGLRQGWLTWPVAGTNASPRPLVVEIHRATLRLLPGDQWALDDFQAALAGVNLTLSGMVTNASAVRDWPLFQGRPPAGTTQRRLRHLAETLEHIHFTTPPKMRLTINGDARDLRSFTVRSSLEAPDADTPWGRISGGVFTARLLPAAPLAPVRADLSLQAADAQTPWAAATGLELEAHLCSSAGHGNIVDAELTATAARVHTRWVDGTNVHFAASWTHSLTNAVPLSGRGELLAAGVHSRWVGGRDLRLGATLAPAANPPPADTTWAGWTHLQPFQLDWAGELSQPDTEKLDARKIVCAGRWRAPELAVTNLLAVFPDGRLEARAHLDVATRRARFDLTSNFDVQRVAPLLTEKSRRWLGQFSWRTPPVLAGGGTVRLPAWTNRQPDWRGEVQPTLRLAGEFAITNGAYRGVSADWARSHFSYSNQVWLLPDLEAGRPDGQLRLEHRADEAARTYYWRVHSTVAPRAIQPLLATNEQRAFDLVTLTQPPVVEGEVWGRMYAPERLGFRGRVALTNFAVRGETADTFEASVRYTNRLLEFFDPHLRRGTQTLSAAAITVDFNTERIHFTNGFSTAEPLVVARAIGPKIGRTLEPYRFNRPPRVRVNGYAPFHGSQDADLHFDVDSAGAEFAWWKFQVPRITGDVHWLGETLTLTNVQAGFYGGDAAGFAHFDFTPERGDEFRFTVGVTNASLPALVTAVSGRTNRLEGDLSGWLVIAQGNTADAASWAGNGRARLRDGFLWELPIFGILSKPLDVFLPGVANSRFSEAAARFTVTNGAVAWDKLEMRAPAMRLQYDGWVDFDGRVDMRVEVEPLRNTWLVGRLFSLALWPVSKLFQYRVTGTLAEPKSEPVYVPKLLMFPLQPFRTLEELFAPDAAKTNGPPVFQPVPEP